MSSTHSNFYLQSYTTPYMGWKIHIVDNFRRRPSFGSACRAGLSSLSMVLVLALVR